MENTDKENMPNKIETDIQTKESLLLEKTSFIISKIPDGIEFTPEISEVVFGSNNALARYCTHCPYCRFDITMPFTIILKDKKDSCKTLTVPDLLHIELNSYNYNNCIHKQDCECGALVNLINKCGMRIENEIKITLLLTSITSILYLRSLPEYTLTSVIQVYLIWKLEFMDQVLLLVKIIL